MLRFLSDFWGKGELNQLPCGLIVKYPDTLVLRLQSVGWGVVLPCLPASVFQAVWINLKKKRIKQLQLKYKHLGGYKKVWGLRPFVSLPWEKPNEPYELYPQHIRVFSIELKIAWPSLIFCNGLKRKLFANIALS